MIQNTTQEPQNEIDGEISVVSNEVTEQLLVRNTAVEVQTNEIVDLGSGTASFGDVNVIESENVQIGNVTYVQGPININYQVQNIQQTNVVRQNYFVNVRPPPTGNNWKVIDITPHPFGFLGFRSSYFIQIVRNLFVW